MYRVSSVCNTDLILNYLFFYCTRTLPFCKFVLLTQFRRGRVDDFKFFDCSSPFCFFVNEFHSAFSISYEILQYCFLLFYFDQVVRGWDFFFFVPAVLLTLVCFMSVIILAVPMRQCSGKHSCMSYIFPIAILNGSFFFPTVTGDGG